MRAVIGSGVCCGRHVAAPAARAADALRQPPQGIPGGPPEAAPRVAAAGGNSFFTVYLWYQIHVICASARK